MVATIRAIPTNHHGGGHQKMCQWHENLTDEQITKR